MTVSDTGSEVDEWWILPAAVAGGVGLGIVLTCVLVKGRSFTKNTQSEVVKLQAPTCEVQVTGRPSHLLKR